MSSNDGREEGVIEQQLGIISFRGGLNLFFERTGGIVD
jgi:hypothetical protein